jgi:hypothetical protein
VALFGFDMTEGPATTSRVRWVAGIAAVVGPVLGVLPYVSDITVIAYWFLAYVWLMVFAGISGIGLGGFAFHKGSKIVGTICFLTNIPVLAYYGFLAFWSASGGSR